jgi:hypothetical protein
LLDEGSLKLSFGSGTIVDADQFLALLGRRADDPAFEAAFAALHTRRRPELDPEDRDALRDWVVVRKHGLELGFVDEIFFLAGEKWRRRRKGVPLILDQVYFYTAFDDISTFAGRLPFNLQWSNTRVQTRQKLLPYEKTRRSYRKDTWDVPGYRMTLDYKEDGATIASIVCQLGLKPWPEKGRVQPILGIADWLGLFGLPPTSPTLRKRLLPLKLQEWFKQGGDEYEANFTFECGLELYFAPFKTLELTQEPLVVKRTDLVFAAVQFLRARDLDARQWTGELPIGLSFDDTQEMMVNKVGRAPDYQVDNRFSGTAVWHFPKYSLEVYYNNIDNHLARVNLMAPGFWRKS